MVKEFIGFVYTFAVYSLGYQSSTTSTVVDPNFRIHEKFRVYKLSLCKTSTLKDKNARNMLNFRV